MLGLARIIGELIGTYVVQIAGIAGAALVANGVYDTLMAAAAPASSVLG